MYRTCVQPRCTVGFDACRIHHVVHWFHGGASDLANLLPLCELHHHLVHEGGWTLTLAPDRRTTWRTPDGALYFDGITTDRQPTTSCVRTTPRRPPTTMAEIADDLAHALAERGIDTEPAACAGAIGDGRGHPDADRRACVNRRLEIGKGADLQLSTSTDQRGGWLVTTDTNADERRQNGDVDPLHRARDAFAERRWEAAYDAFRGCDGLTGRDLDAVAEASHWLGHPDESIVAYADAYQAHLDAGEDRRASLSALLLACHLRFRGDRVEADGWLARALRVLNESDEGAEHGYPLHLEIPSLLSVDPVAAETSARRMQHLGGVYGDDSLVALGVLYEGRALIKRAQVQEGRAKLDEAMLAVVSDRLKPIWTGAIYCGLLDACHELVDIRRARDWTEAMARWCAPLPAASLYPGICRLHQVEILDLRGAWEDAAAEASAACGDLIGIDVFAVADGRYLLGELCRRRGDLAGAEDAYLRAHEAGRDPQPGFALLRLAQGRTDAASASIAAALAACNGGRLERARLLAAQVDIALVAGDTGLAEAAAAEIADTAAEFESDGLRAVAHRARGAVSLAAGQPVEALASLRLALTAWQELEVPYEAARTRAVLAQAYRSLGDDDAAARECAAARTVFDRLGAGADLRDLDAGDPPPGGLTRREVQVLRLVASGRTNREVAANLVISEKTVARHVANIYAKLGLSSRSAATAFAHRHAIV
jgi:DNA-binding NarL/FixJ family response regulator